MVSWVVVAATAFMPKQNITSLNAMMEVFCAAGAITSRDLLFLLALSEINTKKHIVATTLK
jgi:hypothetical protein